MSDKKIAVEDIPFMMLQSGKITSNMSYWIGDINSPGYQEVSKCPPIQISTLTQNLTDSIMASPDPEDVVSLKALAEELKISLEIANKTIAKLKLT